MKQTKMILLLAIFSTHSFATCTKQEVIKLIDKGFDKTEISSICDIQSKSRWITLTSGICRSYGGKIDGGRCEAKWSDAKAICRTSGGRLPNIEELRAVVSGCGGANTNYGDSDSDRSAIFDRNRANKNYQKCYKAKGFASSYYWSSTSDAGYVNGAWSVHFLNGYQRYSTKSRSTYVRCVRAGQ